MAHFQNQNIHLSIPNSDNENTQTPTSLSINELNQPLSDKSNRQMSIDNLNVNRSRINSFPVPPLPRDETPDDEYFDAECKFINDFSSIPNFSFSSYGRSTDFSVITKCSTFNR